MWKLQALYGLSSRELDEAKSIHRFTCCVFIWGVRLTQMNKPEFYKPLSIYLTETRHPSRFLKHGLGCSEGLLPSPCVVPSLSPRYTTHIPPSLAQHCSPSTIWPADMNAAQLQKLRVLNLTAAADHADHPRNKLLAESECNGIAIKIFQSLKCVFSNPFPKSQGPVDTIIH